MFGNKVDDALNDKIVTLISADVTIEGSVIATHAIRVDGIVNGAVRTKESVIVGSKAVVRGGVIASNLMGATGAFQSTNLPPGWGTRYYAASHELKIVPLNGTTLIVR